jgi:hypothetical protein
VDEYYAIPELDPLVDELIAATAGVDMALERQEKAIAALAEAWAGLEDKRASAYEVAAE